MVDLVWGLVVEVFLGRLLQMAGGDWVVIGGVLGFSVLCSLFSVLCSRFWDCWSLGRGVTARCRHSLGVREWGVWAKVGALGGSHSGECAYGGVADFGEGMFG